MEISIILECLILQENKQSLRTTEKWNTIRTSDNAQRITGIHSRFITNQITNQQKKIAVFLKIYYRQQDFFVADNPRYTVIKFLDTINEHAL